MPEQGCDMQSSNGSLSHSKHYLAMGHSKKSPRMRHALKREAERNVRQDRSRIKDPVSTVEELFRGKKR